MEEKIRKSIENVYVCVRVKEIEWVVEREWKFNLCHLKKKKERKKMNRKKNRKPTNIETETETEVNWVGHKKYKIHIKKFLWSIKIKWTINYNPILLIDILLKNQVLFFIYLLTNRPSVRTAIHRSNRPIRLSRAHTHTHASDELRKLMLFKHTHNMLILTRGMQPLIHIFFINCCCGFLSHFSSSFACLLVRINFFCRCCLFSSFLICLLIKRAIALQSEMNLHF